MVFKSEVKNRQENRSAAQRVCCETHFSTSRRILSSKASRLSVLLSVLLDLRDRCSKIKQNFLKFVTICATSHNGELL